MHSFSNKSPILQTGQVYCLLLSRPLVMPLQNGHVPELEHGARSGASLYIEEEERVGVLAAKVLQKSHHRPMFRVPAIIFDSIQSPDETHCERNINQCIPIPGNWDGIPEQSRVRHIYR